MPSTFMTNCWSQRAAVARRLEDQALAIAAEIRFGVLAAEGELADIAEVVLAGLGGQHRAKRRWRDWRRRRGAQAKTAATSDDRGGGEGG